MIKIEKSSRKVAYATISVFFYKDLDKIIFGRLLFIAAKSVPHRASCHQKGCNEIETLGKCWGFAGK